MREPRIAPLQVMDGRTVASLEEIHEPTVFQGLQDDWPARRKWTTEFFLRNYGNQPVPVRKYPAGSEFTYDVSEQTLTQFLEYWDDVAPDPDLKLERSYLAEWNFVRDCPGLLSDFRIPELFADDYIDRLPEQVRFGRVWLFFGEPGCSTGVHCDTFSTSAWLALLAGSKQLRLVRPEMRNELGSGDSLWSLSTCERIRRAGNMVYEATIRAGEILYIPGDWYHEVRNPERNLMVTANFVEKRLLFSFLSQFESRLTEPITLLRKLRNDQLQSVLKNPVGECLSSELGRADFRIRQSVWAGELTRDLREYQEMLETLEASNVK